MKRVTTNPPARVTIDGKPIVSNAGSASGFARSSRITQVLPKRRMDERVKINAAAEEALGVLLTTPLKKRRGSE
jgi:hypothetical protein